MPEHDSNVSTHFRKLNEGWNAEPNAPAPQVAHQDQTVTLSFVLNSFQFPQFGEEDKGRVLFANCWRYRLGATNDEGWYRGQCRFSKTAPAWGEFYEISGDLRLSECPNDWVEVGVSAEQLKHFLFYFRDQTFECDARDWKFELVEATNANAANASVLKKNK
jgi:hypothetical protein